MAYFLRRNSFHDHVPLATHCPWHFSAGFQRLLPGLGVQSPWAGLPFALVICKVPGGASAGVCLPQTPAHDFLGSSWWDKLFFPDESNVPPCLFLGLWSAYVHFKDFVTLGALVCTWLLSDCNVERKEGRNSDRLSSV